MNINLKFYKDQSHFCGDICKTILSFKNHQFSIYFAYFASFVLPKSSKIDNFLRLMEFFENWKSKCHNLMEKSTPVLGYRLLPSLSNKQFKNYSFLRSPCSWRKSIHNKYKFISIVMWLSGCHNPSQRGNIVDRKLAWSHRKFRLISTHLLLLRVDCVKLSEISYFFLENINSFEKGIYFL